MSLDRQSPRPRLLLVLLACVSGCRVQSTGHAELAAPPAVAPVKAERIADAGNRFAFELHQQLRSADGNLFYSPYSLSAALAMAYVGARGETAAQMARVMHYDPDADALAAGYAELAAALGTAKDAGHTLSIANALWGQTGYAFRAEFLELLRARFGAPLHQVDFAGAPAAACERINAWVAEETRDKITELVEPDALPAMLQLMITNAIYFKAAWRFPFDAQRTQPMPFTLISGETTEVAMMQQQARLSYAENDDWQVVALPYGEAGEIDMVVLLPRAVDGLSALERSLTAARFAALTQPLRSREVLLGLPRFELTAKLQLADVLPKLGMRDAFLPSKADFTGMSGRPDLFIGTVIHKAYVDVNEKGTEAAAVTGIGMRATAVPAPPKRFLADHPFLFVIRDTRSGAILFLGRLSEPGR